MLDALLRAAYGLNIVILLPVVGWMLAGANGPMVQAFEHKVADSPGLRILVASLWAAILLCSLLGLAQPRAFVGVMLLQVIYKSLYLLLFIGPLVRERGWNAAPMGVTVTFIIIVALWPGLIWAAWAAR
ncbi:MAG: hypothetical protein GC145_08590 [Caulobacter sp.]|nr:hypothetical protein [Caulobacter sp.]